MLKVWLQLGLRKSGQPPCPSAGPSSHYAVIRLPAVKTSCKVSHLLTKANAGGWTGPRRSPLSLEPTRAADVPLRWSSCRPGTPGLPRGSAARSRALQAGARRARAAAHGRVPSPRAGSLSANCRFLLSASGGSRDVPNPRPRKQVARRRRRLAGTPLRKPTVELGAPQQSGAPAPSAGSRAAGAPSAQGWDRDWLPGRARVSQGSTRTPTPIRPAPRARERPGARACLTAVTETARKTGNASRVPEASGKHSRLPCALVRPRRLRRRGFGQRMLRCHEPEVGGRGEQELGVSELRRAESAALVSRASEPPNERPRRGDVSASARRMTASTSHVVKPTPMGGAAAT